ncbi:MAG: M6 family metalloprotease domain-containing protein, partial [Planctomycetota bacterium]
MCGCQQSSARFCIYKPGGSWSELWPLCGILLLFLATSPRAHGDPVFGEVFPYRQPDGTLIEVRVWGDEFYRVVESLDGYTLVRNQTTGAACYARLSPDGRELISTGVPVGSAFKAGPNLTQHIRINPASARAKIAAARARFAADESGAVGALPARSQFGPPNIGNVQGIVLLVDFEVDEPWSIPASEIDNYCNQVGYTGYGNNGSVRDYFYDVSDGILTYTNFVPATYYRAQHPRSYYEDPEAPLGTRVVELIIEALTDLDNQGFDFSQYDSDHDGYVDGVNCFYAGTRKPFWAQGLWPHCGAVSFTADGVSTLWYQITDIGSSLTLRAFCHENGHMICYWPDLYDYGFESTGVGDFCLMCYGPSNTNPAEPSAYLKYIAGWSTTTVLSTPQAGLSVPSGVNTLYKYEHPTLSNEYFLIENRQTTGRDGAIPDAGLAIWHIDTLSSNDNEEMTPDAHYLVTLVQADGDWDLEYDNNRGDSADLWEVSTCAPDTYPNTAWWDGSGSGLSIANISASGTSMTFDLNTLTDCNINTVPDAQDVSTGTSLDCNGNIVPDECDLAVRFSSSSGDLSPIGNGSVQSYTVVSPPLALRHVTLYFEAVGDFGTTEQRIDVNINGTSVGSVFEVGGYSCEAAPDRDGIVVPSDTFNAAVAGGDAVINMVASPGVDPYACDSYVRVTLEYEAVGVSCNQDGIPDDCDIATGSSDDCNTNGVPDECDTTGGGVLLEADFEGGLPAGWTALGAFQITDQCGSASAACVQEPWAYAGDTATCTYGSEEWGELITPQVTLGYGLSEVSFCSRLGSVQDYDYASVLVNGTRVWRESGLRDQWVDKAVDLGAFAGQTVSITFRFAGGTYVSGTLGWQVDSVTVTSGVADDNDNGIPDECEDCNDNGVDDECDADCTAAEGECNVPGCGLSPDCNDTGIPDECELTDNDCNFDGRPDECGVIDDCLGDVGTFPAALNSDDDVSGRIGRDREILYARFRLVGEDCNCNGAADVCELDAGTAKDCNENQALDECDIDEGESEDCNGNSIPDECEIDEGIAGPGGPFFCDPAAPPQGLDECAPDCNTNGTPDECEEDCNHNGIPDECDIDEGTSEDCNADGRPDECGVTDECLYDFMTAAAPLNSNAAYDTGFDVFAQLAGDGQGNWLAVWESSNTLGGTIGSDRDILFSGSTDNGAGWTAPAPLNAYAASDFGHERLPQLTTDGQGNWLAVWYSTNHLGGTIGTDWDILFSHSTDNGASWTDDAPLNSNAVSDSGDDICPQLTTDGQGNWLAVWESYDDLGGTFGIDHDILVSRSTDNGASWTAPAPLNSNAASDSGDDYDPQLTTNGRGDWLAVWESTDDFSGTIGTDGDILFSNSTDNGASWTVPTPINSNAASDSGDDAFPQLTSDGQGNWLAVWESTNDLGGTIGIDNDILFSRSTGDGTRWTVPAPLNSNAASDWSSDTSPQLTTDGQGNWVALWHSNDSLGWTIGTDWDILFSHSTDNGASWTDAAPVDSYAASDVGYDRSPQLTSDGQGNWLGVWHSENDLGGTIGTDYDILFLRFRSVDEDCNCNGMPDKCEPDCQPNGVADECDISSGASTDDNGNDIPDECELRLLRLPGPPHDTKKHRYLSVDPSTNAARSVAVMVEVAEMRRCQNAPTRGCLTDADCDDVCDDSAGDPPHYTLVCPPNDCSLTDPPSTCIASGPCVDLAPSFSPPLAWIVQEPVQQADGEWTATLSDTVYSQDWSASSLLHIGDCGIVPCVTYHVYACDPLNLDTCSQPLEVATQRFPELARPVAFPLYGDVAGGTVMPGPTVLPPDSCVNVKDVMVTLLTIQNYGGPDLPQAHPTWVDLHGLGTGIPPNYILGVADLQAVYVFSLTNGFPWVNT